MKLTKILIFLVFVLLVSGVVMAIVAPYTEECKGSIDFKLDEQGKEILMQKVGDVPGYAQVTGAIGAVTSYASMISSPGIFFASKLQNEAWGTIMAQVPSQVTKMYAQAKVIQEQIKNKQIDIPAGGKISIDCNGKSQYKDVEVQEDAKKSIVRLENTCKSNVDNPTCASTSYKGGKLNTNPKTNEEEFIITSKDKGYFEHCESTSSNKEVDCNKYNGLASGSFVKTKEVIGADGKTKKVITEGKFIVGDENQPIPIENGIYKFSKKGAEVYYKAEYGEDGNFKGSKMTFKGMSKEDTVNIEAKSADKEKPAKMTITMNNDQKCEKDCFTLQEREHGKPDGVEITTSNSMSIKKDKGDSMNINPNGGTMQLTESRHYPNTIAVAAIKGSPEVKYGELNFKASDTATSYLGPKADIEKQQKTNLESKSKLPTAYVFMEDNKQNNKDYGKKITVSVANLEEPIEMSLGNIEGVKLSGNQIGVAYTEYVEEASIDPKKPVHPYQPPRKGDIAVIEIIDDPSALAAVEAKKDAETTKPEKSTPQIKITKNQEGVTAETPGGKANIPPAPPPKKEESAKPKTTKGTSAKKEEPKESETSASKLAIEDTQQKFCYIDNNMYSFEGIEEKSAAAGLSQSFSKCKDLLAALSDAQEQEDQGQSKADGQPEEQEYTFNKDDFNNIPFPIEINSEMYEQAQKFVADPYVQNQIRVYQKCDNIPNEDVKVQCSYYSQIISNYKSTYKGVEIPEEAPTEQDDLDLEGQGQSIPPPQEQTAEKPKPTQPEQSPKMEITKRNCDAIQSLINGQRLAGIPKENLQALNIKLGECEAYLLPKAKSLQDEDFTKNPLSAEKASKMIESPDFKKVPPVEQIRIKCIANPNQDFCKGENYKTAIAQAAKPSPSTPPKAQVAEAQRPTSPETPQGIKYFDQATWNKLQALDKSGLKETNPEDYKFKYATLRCLLFGLSTQGYEGYYCDSGGVFYIAKDLR